MSETLSAQSSLRGPIILGCLIVAIALGGFGLWSATMQLASAAIAPGTVIVKNRRAKVQHFEGGIITQLNVREGEYVEEGDTLLLIANAEESAKLERLTARQIGLEAERVRLRAEIDERETVDFSDYKLTWDNATDALDSITLQTELFEVRRNQLKNALAVAINERKRTQQTIIGVEAQLKARTIQRNMIQDRLRGYKALLTRGNATKVQVDELKAQVAGLTADIAQLGSAKKAGAAELARKNDEIQRVRASYAVRSGDRLNTVELELTEIQEARVAALDVIKRTEIKAPIEGRVVGISVNTIGAIISSGDTLMELVPARDELVVEALIRPEDIDVVHSGLPVDVRLTALSFRNTLPLVGTLQQISADRIVEGRSGAAIYKGIITLDNAADTLPDGVKLYPGMGAEVAIKTGERTVLQYLLDPLSKAVSRSFRES